MASRKHQQLPYSTLPLPEADGGQQFYQHPAQASQFSLHTPTDPAPPDSSFRSPLPPIPPRVPSGEFLPRSPDFLQMEHQSQQQQATSSATNQRRITRVFDGDESPVESPVELEFSNQQSQLEYLDQVQGIEHAHQPQEQQYQGREQLPTDYQRQPQEQYEQPPTDYSHQQAYDARLQSQHAAAAPLPSPETSQSQVDHHSQNTRRTPQQYGPSPQYVSSPHSLSFPPPPQSPPPHSLSFPPPPGSATFTPQSLSFPPPPHSPSFSPHSPSFSPHSPSFSPHSPSFSPPPQPHSPGYLPHTPGYAPHTPIFPPPPTSEMYQSPVPTTPGTIPVSTATPPPGGQGVEMVARPPMPPMPINAPTYRPGLEGPRTPVYTPGGGSGPNGGIHAPGQIGHPNQQHGKEEYSHGLCDCFSEPTTCCVGYWCPCILYSRTNHRLKTSPNSNLNGFHTCNGHCVGFCVLAPVSWIFTLFQRGRIRDKYRLEGTVMSDCGKAYCCVMCTLVQDEREVTEREDERRRNAGPGSGVVGEQGYRRHGGMVYG